MRKLLLSFFAAVMALSFVACDNSNEPVNPQPQPQPQPQPSAKKVTFVYVPFLSEDIYNLCDVSLTESLNGCEDKANILTGKFLTYYFLNAVVNAQVSMDSIPNSTRAMGYLYTREATTADSIVLRLQLTLKDNYAEILKGMKTEMFKLDNGLYYGHQLDGHVLYCCRSHSTSSTKVSIIIDKYANDRDAFQAWLDKKAGLMSGVLSHNGDMPSFRVSVAE